MWFDFPVLDFIQNNLRYAFLDTTIHAVTIITYKGLIWVVLGLVLLIPKKTRPAAAAGLAAMILCFLVGEVALKNIVCRIRPYDAFEAYHGFAMPFTLNSGAEHGFSFPSWHTLCSFAAAVCAFKINKTSGVITTLFAMVIAFSRLYNYLHYPTDVLAGILIGIAFGLLFVFIFKKFNLDNKLTNIGKKSS